MLFYPALSTNFLVDEKIDSLKVNNLNSCKFQPFGTHPSISQSRMGLNYAIIFNPFRVVFIFAHHITRKFSPVKVLLLLEDRP